MGKLLNMADWRPLERDDLPLCIYESDVPFEEAYLETLVSDLRVDELLD